MVVIDADRVARDVLDPGEPALEAVIARFGRSFVGADGVARPRGARADRVRRPGGAARPRGDRPSGGPAADPGRDRGSRGGRRPTAVVIEAIKLVEGGLAELCDEVWLVTCDPEAQRQRLLGRGANSADTDERIAAQAVWSNGSAGRDAGGGYFGRAAARVPWSRRRLMPLRRPGATCPVDARGRHAVVAGGDKCRPAFRSRVRSLVCRHGHRPTDPRGRPKSSITRRPSIRTPVRFVRGLVDLTPCPTSSSSPHSSRPATSRRRSRG